MKCYNALTCFKAFLRNVQINKNILKSGFATLNPQAKSNTNWYIHELAIFVLGRGGGGAKLITMSFAQMVICNTQLSIPFKPGLVSHLKI